MSFTPAKTSIVLDNTKTSGGIRKSLLTPCRRVGLSRVVKTPASLEKTVKTTNSPSICNTPTNSELKSNSTARSEDKRQVCEVVSEKKVVESVKRPRKMAKKCLILDDEVCPKKIEETILLRNEEESVERVCNSGISEVFESVSVLDSQSEENDSKKNKSRNKVVREVKKSVKKCLLPKETENLSNSIVSPKSSNSSQLRNCNTDKSMFKGFSVDPKKGNKTISSSKNHIHISDPEDDFQPVAKLRKIRRISSSSESSAKEKPMLQTTNSSGKVKKSSKKQLSMKKSKCSETGSFKYDSDNEFLPSPINSQEITNNVRNLTKMPLLYEEMVTTEAKSSAPDDNDFYELDEKLIENRIKEKEERLNGLKRAEVYLKKHNVTELNELRLKWRNGCCEALRDLLRLLKDHENITMDVLLKRLNIPENMIQYNLENGELL